MPAGLHSITASAAGYQGDTNTEVEVLENADTVVDFALEPVAPGDGQEEGKQPGDRKGYVGSFTLGDGFFTVTTKKEEVIIRIPAGGLEPITRVPRPPADAEEGQADAPVDGAQVAVLVEFLLPEGGTDLVLEARQIMVKPNHEPPVAGAVVSIETDEDGVRTLTIMRPNGTTKEVRLGPEVTSPEVGDFVTTFPGRGRKGRGQGEGDDGEPPTATGLVLAEQVLQRLEGFLQDLTSEDSNLSTKAAERRSQQVADVAALLETHASEHVDLLEKISQKENLPPQAILAMLKHLDKAKGGRDRANGKVKEARDKAGPPPGRGNQGQGSQGQGSQSQASQGQSSQGQASQGQSSQGQGSQGQGSQGQGSQGQGSQGQASQGRGRNP